MHDDFRQSKDFQQLLGKHGFAIANLAKNQVGYVHKTKVLPFLSTMMVPRIDDALALDKIDDFARKSHSIFISLVPKVDTNNDDCNAWHKELLKHGYKPAKFGIAPTKTLIVDLSPSDKAILDQMKSKTRYNIRLAARKGVKTKIKDGQQVASQPNLLEQFYKVYAENCRRVNMKCESISELGEFFRAFGEHLFVVYAFAENDALFAVASFIVSGDTVSYQMNGSTEAGRHIFAPSLIVWEGMQEGKKRGCSWFDFDGIYDDRFPKSQKQWEGFTRFKSGFGGQEVTYIGSFIKWFPFLKRAH